MLSDLAPLEMSAPEPADARLSGVGSAQTPLRLAQLLPVRSRTTHTLNETRQAAEMNRAIAPFPRISATRLTLASLFGEVHLLLSSCCCSERALAALLPDVQGGGGQKVHACG
ncbi:hypothetical protein PBY51_003634 [Eleginops maclovinus]|uniref:Uncharacterized protein n=1 Tax=Eleginops maclovinus TaxID=56733 RepID=A0AAN7XYC9_ELEMC|nr:hypothetical protein PBY51_003634 [Eleginops maclovinus]